jgi:hypothetical protein
LWIKRKKVGIAVSKTKQLSDAIFPGNAKDKKYNSKGTHDMDEATRLP